MYPNGGENNAGLYLLHKDYKGHKADGVVVKRMPEPIDNEAWGEVKALDTVGYLIDSGLMLVKVRTRGQHKVKRIPVILMKRIPGVVPQKTPVWHQGKAQKAELMEHVKLKVKKEIVNWAVEKNLLHL
jgi:hypothetical protein